MLPGPQPRLFLWGSRVGNRIAGVDPLELELFRKAASGERQALSLLAQVSRQADSYDHSRSAAERTAVAEAFARLAAMQGDPADKMLLADILVERSCTATDATYSARLLVESADLMREAMEGGHSQAGPSLAVLLSILSDGGDEAAAIELNKLMEQLGPAQVAEVNRLRELAQ
jgi:hypothetical protein